jgi:CheY-like chemotaxis protein
MSHAKPGGGEPSRPVVVCIDDDPPVLAAIRRLLRREPYEVITTLDPQRVLELMRERPIHLIVADQRMPQMAGTELLKRVRELSPSTIGVILTGHADLSDIAGAMNDGAVDRLIRKPWSDEEFRRMIRELLAVGRTSGVESPAQVGTGAPGLGGGASNLPAATVKHLECRGQTPASLLMEISEVLYAPEGPPHRLVIVFEHLPDLAGSLNVLMTELVRLIVRSGARAALVDGSGTAGTFLELVGGRLPVVVYLSASEMSAPKKLLVVEDHLENLEYLKSLIESAGHACVAVGSVGEALRQLESSSFDLVLLDLVLPDADGVEVARYILEKGLKLPVVAVSGYLDRWADESFSHLGIRRQVSKPYRAREILDAIRDS